MALSPLQPEDERAIEITTDPAIGRTYEFDFETGQFTGAYIDDEDAIKQFIIKAISTARFRYMIYDDQYGCEIQDLIADNLPQEYVDAEIRRMIEEALIYDDRIASVSNFVVTFNKDELHVQFLVTLVQGSDISMEVTF